MTKPKGYRRNGFVGIKTLLDNRCLSHVFQVLARERERERRGGKGRWLQEDIQEREKAEEAIGLTQIL